MIKNFILSSSSPKFLAINDALTASGVKASSPLNPSNSFIVLASSSESLGSSLGDDNKEEGVGGIASPLSSSDNLFSPSSLEASATSTLYIFKGLPLSLGFSPL